MLLCCSSNAQVMCILKEYTCYRGPDSRSGDSRSGDSRSGAKSPIPVLSHHDLHTENRDPYQIFLDLNIKSFKVNPQCIYKISALTISLQYPYNIPKISLQYPYSIATLTLYQVPTMHMCDICLIKVQENG